MMMSEEERQLSNEEKAILVLVLANHGETEAFKKVVSYDPVLLPLADRNEMREAMLLELTNSGLIQQTTNLLGLVLHLRSGQEVPRNTDPTSRFT